MRKVRIFATCIFLGAFHSNLSRAASIENKVYRWLLRQQNPETGLLGNQEGDRFSGVYSNALAALCFLYKGDADRARKIFLFYQDRMESEFAEETPKGFRQFWYADSGRVAQQADRWIGDNAWLLIALNYYARQTSSDEFDNLRWMIAKWLIRLQDQDGGILAGYTVNGKMTHKSTEGNLDCYAALADYPLERSKIANYLRSKMWVEAEKRLRMGSTVRESSLDCISWGVAAFGDLCRESLKHGEDRFARTAVSDANHKEIVGFADFLDKKRVWLEGTGQMVVAYRASGNAEKAEKFLRELEKAIMPSEIFWGTAGLPFSTNDPTWEGATRKIFVPSQAWYLFGKWGFNPMDASSYSLSQELASNFASAGVP